MAKYIPGQKCSFKLKGKVRNGLILNIYEELGGASDGQHYVVVEDFKTKKARHIKNSDVIKIINKV